MKPKINQVPFKSLTLNTKYIKIHFQNFSYWKKVIIQIHVQTFFVTLCYISMQNMHTNKQVAVNSIDWSMAQQEKTCKNYGTKKLSISTKKHIIWGVKNVNNFQGFTWSAQLYICPSTSLGRGKDCKWCFYNYMQYAPSF